MSHTLCSCYSPIFSSYSPLLWKFALKVIISSCYLVCMDVANSTHDAEMELTNPQVTLARHLINILFHLWCYHWHKIFPYSLIFTHPPRSDPYWSLLLSVLCVHIIFFTELSKPLLSDRHDQFLGVYFAGLKIISREIQWFVLLDHKAF